jgi:hypothetical protein
MTNGRVFVVWALPTVARRLRIVNEEAHRTRTAPFSADPRNSFLTIFEKQNS